MRLLSKNKINKAESLESEGILSVFRKHRKKIIFLLIPLLGFLAKFTNDQRKKISFYLFLHETKSYLETLADNPENIRKIVFNPNVEIDHNIFWTPEEQEILRMRILEMLNENGDYTKERIFLAVQAEMERERREACWRSKVPEISHQDILTKIENIMPLDQVDISESHIVKDAKYFKIIIPQIHSDPFSGEAPWQTRLSQQNIFAVMTHLYNQGLSNIISFEGAPENVPLCYLNLPEVTSRKNKMDFEASREMLRNNKILEYVFCNIGEDTIANLHSSLISHNAVFALEILRYNDHICYGFENIDEHQEVLDTMYINNLKVGTTSYIVSLDREEYKSEGFMAEVPEIITFLEEEMQETFGDNIEEFTNYAKGKFSDFQKLVEQGKYENSLYSFRIYLRNISKFSDRDDLNEEMFKERNKRAIRVSDYACDNAGIKVSSIVIGASPEHIGDITKQLEIRGDTSYLVIRFKALELYMEETSVLENAAKNLDGMLESSVTDELYKGL